MKKNIFSSKKALLALFAMLMPLLASAHDFEVNGIYYNITSEDNKTVEVSGYRYINSSDFTFPAIVTHESSQYRVINIGSRVFKDCTTFRSIKLSEGITTISDDAFNGCSNLQSVSIPASVENISERTFILCSNLTTITIDNNNPIYSDGEDNAIIEKATKTLIAGTTVGIPEGIDSIADFAFGGRFFSPEDVIIPEGCTAIGKYAFIECSADRIYIPTTLKKCSRKAFLYPDGARPYHTNIEEVHIKDLSAWLNIDFEDCNANPLLISGTDLFLDGVLLDTITIPQNVSVIKKNAFAGWIGKKAIITENVTCIEENAFWKCKELTMVVINKGVTTIKWNAFYGCNNLSFITLPNSLTNIDTNAFENCTKLKDVYCYAENIPSTDQLVFEGFSPENATLHVPASALESYKSTAPWNSFGKIESIKTPISEITLSHTSATLTEGESLTLSATITPEDASDSSVTWSSSDEDVAMVSSKGRVITLAAGTAIITATANDGSGVSASCEVRVVIDKCDVPTISYVNGEFTLTCSTEGAEIRTTVTTENDSEFIGTRFEFIPTHTFTVCATKEQYEDSDVATLTVCWIPCTEEHESEETGILTIPSKPVLISTQGGTITVSGLAADTEVAAYTTAGTQLATATATGGTITLDTGLEAGSIAIVKIGEHSVKIAVE